MTRATDSRPRASMRLPGMVTMLLRLPLYYKLVIANAVITLVAVLACASLLNPATHPNFANARLYVWAIIMVATVVGVAVNSIVVRIALSPIRDLERAADAVRAGDENMRAEPNPLSDAQTAQVVTVFNAMLDSLAHYRQRLRETAIRAIASGETERSRLSRELHDGVAQELAAVLVQLRLLRRTTSCEAHEQLDAIADQVAASMNELRATAQSLRPPSLDMIGVSASIKSYAKHFEVTTGIEAQVRVDAIDHVLSKESEIALYRIIQDALRNTAEHANASMVMIDVTRQDDSVVATVTDSGRGFDLASMSSDGMGLFEMNERAVHVGGRVEFRSSPAGGTVVTITLPIGERAYE